MTPDVVVDIGNSRMKWGWMPNGGPMRMVSLASDDIAVWESQRNQLHVAAPLQWVVSGVHPKRVAGFVEWVVGHGDSVTVVRHEHIPLRIDVDEPKRVGIDRLLSATAASHRAHPQPAVVLSVGTAVTADYVDDSRTFRGGVILPGPRLMAESLHAHTAQLPLVDAHEIPDQEAPGRNTTQAILAGIRYAILGAAYLLVDRYASLGCSPWVFVTGGAAGDLKGIDFGDSFMRTQSVPALTLEGVRIAAEALP